MLTNKQTIFKSLFFRPITYFQSPNIPSSFVVQLCKRERKKENYFLFSNFFWLFLIVFFYSLEVAAVAVAVVVVVDVVG